MNKNEIPLQPSFYYHIYNRAVGNDNLFYSHSNYLYFLKKCYEYIVPIADIFTYCLMPNHFHLLIRIKTEDEINRILIQQNRLVKKQNSIELYISKQFSNFFNGYSQAINKQQSRNGSLFSRPFKRKQVDAIDYLRNLVVYIHLNPVSHGFVSHAKDWMYSSYIPIISGKNLILKKEEVIDWFEDIDNLTKTHGIYNQSNLVNLEWD